jgi:hypothetical protein
MDERQLKIAKFRIEKLKTSTANNTGRRAYDWEQLEVKNRGIPAMTGTDDGCVVPLFCDKLPGS